jgi:hypothetical protein
MHSGLLCNFGHGRQSLVPSQLRQPISFWLAWLMTITKKVSVLLGE